MCTENCNDDIIVKTKEITSNEFNKDMNDTELGNKTDFDGWKYADFVWVMKKIFKNKFRDRKIK
jgi:hypothetical protein